MIQKYYIDDTAGGGGGDPKVPTAPKGYSVTTPQQRTEWNGFLDYLDKQGVAGKPDLDAPGAGLKYFQQYKKANPDISLTPEHIQNIQYEQYQLRKGDQFGSLNKMQLDHLRSGLAPAYLSRPVSDVNGQINSATSKLYYPSGQSYGTDIEHYDAALGQPVAAPGPKVSSRQAVPPPVAIPTAASSLISAYSQHDMAAARVQQLAKQPGNEFLHGRGDALINASFVPSTDSQSFRDSSIKATKSLGLDPNMFWASAAEEGTTGLIPDKKGAINTDPNIDLNGKYPVSGFANFGMDHFHGDFKDMVARGYLPKDFDYKKSMHTNENGEQVASGDFKTVADALQGKAAYIRMHQDDLDKWAKDSNVQLSPVARQFFTYMSYNGGPGTAHKLINYYKAKGLLDGDKFLAEKPPHELDKADSYGKVLPRWQMAQLMNKEKLFN